MVTKVVAITPSAHWLVQWSAPKVSSQPTKEKPAAKSYAHITCNVDTAHHGGFSATPASRAQNQDIAGCELEFVLVTQLLA